MVIGSGGLGVAGLPVLFGFSQLCDDWDSQERLSGELDSSRDGFLAPEFDITDARSLSAYCVPLCIERQRQHGSTNPLDRPLTRSLTI